VREKSALFAAYMPFVSNGGLFIPTEKSFKLGDEILVLLTLPDETARVPAPSRVVWITPARAQGNRARGIGVQFNSTDKGSTRRLIETHLGGLLTSASRNHTL
jgi:type IV pilus assembly protein PilZ